MTGALPDAIGKTIRRLWRDGMPTTAIAAELGVGVKLVRARLQAMGLTRSETRTHAALDADDPGVGDPPPRHEHIAACRLHLFDLCRCHPEGMPLDLKSRIAIARATP